MCCGEVWGSFLFMASLRKVKSSPYWYVRYRDLETGGWKDECLKLRCDDRNDSLKAHREAAKRSANEKKVAPMCGDDFTSWVPDYLESHYKNPRSLLRYQYVWSVVNGWLLSKKVRHPRELKYQHANEYLKWRKGAGASHNTARMEVKFLSFVVSEAIRRELADRNVIALTRVELEERELKKELTDEDIKKAREAFKSQPKWMGIAFEILIHLGCRFNEARIPKSRVDFKERTITLEDSKRKPGHSKRKFLVPMTDQLAAYLEKIKWSGEFTIPPLDRGMNQSFNAVLFKACGTTSHSCRVSFITRCHRAGLSESEAMALVNHSTRMVHRVYSRLNIKDSTDALQRVKAPPPPLQ